MPYAEFLGRREQRTDRVDPRLAEGLAATLGRPLPAADLPPLWHWMLFQDWRPPAGLGRDGHPSRGGFLPPVHDLPRRMWAGGQLDIHGTLRIDEVVTRETTITAIEQKEGTAGRLVFVSLRHDIAGPRGPVLTERQDLVYRSAEGAALRAAAPAPDWPGATRADADTGAVTLFRYSALTGNGHRIHYDFPYATGVEGYPGLVVHGPLQATWLAQHALDMAPGERLVAFAFRGRRAAIGDRPLTLLGARDGRTIRLETRDEIGATCLAAEATLA
jgi:hydroxyacyl-ACP dehydratase HTD2-like protein with hotdog domain